jgi:hypothetical protein
MRCKAQVQAGFKVFRVYIKVYKKVHVHENHRVEPKDARQSFEPSKKALKYFHHDWQSIQ